MVLGVIAGQAVPLFTGALPEAEVRRFLDELMRVAIANGVTGRLSAPADDSDVDEQPADVPPQRDPHADAMERLVAGDLDAAAAEYEQLLAASPGDPDAARGLALVELARRVERLDPESVVTTAAQRPDDVDAQREAADLEFLNGDVDAAFSRLVETVRRTAGDEREAARAHLVGLFDALGASDPRVVAARTALANALF